MASTSGFNEPEFLEYDPTPYGGGYDVAATYGKPLSPSDVICYPRSVSKANSSPPSLNGLPDRSVTPPNGEGTVGQAASPKSSPEVEAEPHKEDEEEKPWPNYNGNGLIDPNFDCWGGDIFASGYGICESGYEYDNGKHESNQGDGYSGVDVPQNGYNYYPWSSCGYGEEERRSVNGGQKPYSQCGYDRDELGPCAALFDYWPCLYKKDKKSYGQHDDVENCYGNQWNGAVDYLFGSLYPNGERRDEGVSYGYQKRYQDQPYTVQHEYNEQSLSQNISFFDAYHEDPYSQSNYVKRRDECVISGYQRHYQGEPLTVQYESNEQSWSQNISNCDAFYEEPYPRSNYVEECYGGNNEYLHYHQLKFSNYDE